jgi:TrmH family RNA methyltransferase
MNTITSRNNAYIRHFRKLAADRDYRAECREYVCDGAKMLEEAILAGMKIGTVLWKGTEPLSAVEAEQQFLLPADLFDYASSMKNSPGPLFTVSFPSFSGEEPIRNAIILENVQDPGNVGTVIRTANAFRFDSVVLIDACADCTHPKTVRASMGAVFRQRIDVLPLSELKGFLENHSLRLYGAELSPDASDIRGIRFENTAVAVGSEGHGLSTELLDMCDKRIIIPMDPHSESLNAAVASAVIMWEMKRQDL